jgi:hypothetical protein
MMLVLHESAKAGAGDMALNAATPLAMTTAAANWIFRLVCMMRLLESHESEKLTTQLAEETCPPQRADLETRECSFTLLL